MKKVGHTPEFPFGIYWWTLKNPKKSESWKNEKKLLEISSFYTCVSKTTIICCAVPETWRENQNFEKMKKASGDVIILNLCNKKHKCMLTQIWSETNIIYCNFRPFFALLPHHWPWKLKFRKIWTPGDIIP